MPRLATKGALLAWTLWGLIAVGGAPPLLHAQQTPVAKLIVSARQEIENLNLDSAAALLRQALAPGAVATTSEQVRARVLAGVVELTTGKTDSAVQDFRSAIALQPDLSVDSLASLHDSLLVVFGRARAAVLAAAPPAPGTLELRGLPPGAILTVDTTRWTDHRGQLPPGTHRIAVTAPGFQPYLDSVTVESGVTLVRDVALQALAPALLSVASVPWGVVYLDGDSVGETPVYQYEVEPGTHTVKVVSPLLARPLERAVTLTPGRLTTLGTLSPTPLITPDTGVLGRADSLFRAIELDSALALYCRVVWDSMAVRDPDVRARAATRAAEIHFALAAGEAGSADLDSARQYFAAAYRFAPTYEPGPAQMGPGMRAAMEAARAQVLLLAVEMPTDTQVAPRGGVFVIAASPSHRAEIRLRIEQLSQPRSPVEADSQLAVTTAAFHWDLRLHDGSLLPPGRYALAVTARDSAGHTAPAIERTLEVERVAVDTLAHPAPPPASAFAPESRRLKHASGLVVVAGLALAAGAISLDDALGNSAMRTGLPRATGSYVVAGSLSLAGLVGFLAGHRTQLLPQNVIRNQELREQYARNLQAVITENTRRRSEAPVRIRVIGGR